MKESAHFWDIGKGILTVAVLIPLLFGLQTIIGLQVAAAQTFPTSTVATTTGAQPPLPFLGTSTAPFATTSISIGTSTFSNFNNAVIGLTGSTTPFGAANSPGGGGSSAGNAATIGFAALAALAVLIAVEAPAAALSVAGVPFGGFVSFLLPCANGVIYTVIVNPDGIGSGAYIWTPATITFAFGPPSHLGQAIIGAAGEPAFCYIPPSFVISGIGMNVVGTSLVP